MNFSDTSQKGHMGTEVFAAILFFSGFCLALNGCASMGLTSAEEYFSIGMAYFEMGQAAGDAAARTKYFGEAEKWLNRARQIDKTQNASEYNLGRIAFETGRYEDAAKNFEGILKKDPGNILALKAASYTRIRLGEIEKAEALYQKLLELAPESADEGYNYALVLYSMEKFARAEQVLESYRFALLDNSDTLLLYARIQKAQEKVEAIDSYSQWLAANTNPKVRFEYAQILESKEFYARALQEYRGALSELKPESKEPQKKDLLFAIGRLLLTADSESDEGIKELGAARDEGFADIEALEKLLDDIRISGANLLSIKSMINELKLAAEKAVPKEDSQEDIQKLEENTEAGTDSPNE